MIITIEGLSYDKYKEMVSDCGKGLFYEINREHEDALVATISPNAIVKICGNVIRFDLGGRKTSVERNDFFSMTLL